MPPTHQEEHDLRRELNKNLSNLNDSINEFSKSSNNLQKNLVFWTKAMVFVILLVNIVLFFQQWRTH